MTSTLARKIITRPVTYPLYKGIKDAKPTHTHTYTHEEFYVDDLDFAETFSALLISTKENYLTITEKVVFTKNTDWCKSVAYFRSLALFCGRCYFRKLPCSKFFNLCKQQKLEDENHVKSIIRFSRPYKSFIPNFKQINLLWRS